MKADLENPPPTSPIWPALFVTALFILTHGGQLAREFGYEESIFAMPGLNLFGGNGFYWSWGEMDPRASAFHKPPLLSILIGLSSLLTHEPTIGAKLVPFFCGWVTVLLPVVLGRGITASILLLASPFFYSAAGHVQTDPTVGLLGYCLGCAGVWRWFQPVDARRGAGLLISAALIVLWLGKIETALLFSAPLFAAAAYEALRGRRVFLFWVLTGSAFGVSALVASIWWLASTTSLGLVPAIAELVGTITRITSTTVTHNYSTLDGSSFSRQLAFMGNFHVLTLVVLLLVPCAGLFTKRVKRISLTGVTTLALLGLIPASVYFLVGYAGDGNPRYYLPAIIPLSLLATAGLDAFSHITSRSLSIFVLALGAWLLCPPTFGLMRSGGNPASVIHDSGYRDAARLVHAMTDTGGLIIAPEPSAFYLPDRRVLVLESFDPYPKRHASVTARLPELQAAIIPTIELAHNNGVLTLVAESLRGNPHLETTIGSFTILVRDRTGQVP